MLCNRTAESCSFPHTFTHIFKRPFRSSNQPHTVVNSSRSKPSLCNCKSFSFAPYHIGRRHPDIRESEVSMAVRSTVITRYRKHSLYFGTSIIHWNQYHGLLFMTSGIWIAFSQENGQLCPRVTCSRGPPFPTVQHIFVAILFDA